MRLWCLFLIATAAVPAGLLDATTSSAATQPNLDNPD